MAGVVAVDQASKGLIEARLDPHTSVPILENFSLVLGYNRGVSFGLLSSEAPYTPYILSLFALVVTLWLGVRAFRTESPLQRGALAFIVGGAASNVIDRLRDGAVTDFLDFHIGALHWPAFNFADVAIVCGIGALLLESLFPATFKPRSMRDERKRHIRRPC